MKRAIRSCCDIVNISSRVDFNRIAMTILSKNTLSYCQPGLRASIPLILRFRIFKNITIMENCFTTHAYQLMAAFRVKRGNQSFHYVINVCCLPYDASFRRFESVNTGRIAFMRTRLQIIRASLIDGRLAPAVKTCWTNVSPGPQIG